MTLQFRLVNNILNVLVALWGIVFIFTEVFVCNLEGHSCSGQKWTLLWFVTGDVAILAMPYPTIRKLQLSKGDKVGVSGILVVGTLLVTLIYQ